MRIRIGSLVKCKTRRGTGLGIVLGQPHKNYPIWTVMMGDGRKATISLGHILEVINENR
jgi:pyruvate/2-oxoacid:ferredoxin oxidoreductase beta subunit